MPGYAGQHVFCSKLQSIERARSLMQFSVCVALQYGHFDIAMDACAFPKLLTNPLWKVTFCTFTKDLLVL